MRRIAWISFFGVLTSLVAAAPAAADAPVVKTATKRLSVPRDRASESKVVCPATMAAITGTVSRQPSGSTLTKSLPSGARTWRFGFRGAVRSGTARAAVRCVALKVPRRAGRVELKVNTVRRGLGVDSLSRAGMRLNCRRGYVPTGWGHDIPSEEVHVYQALANSSSYTFALENIGKEGHAARLRVRCLDRATAGRAGLSHTWRVNRYRHSDSIRGGLRTVGHSCRGNALSIGLGHSVDPAGDMLFRRAYDRRTGSGRWVFDNAGLRARVTTQLLCLSTGTDFR